MVPSIHGCERIHRPAGKALPWSGTPSDSIHKPTRAPFDRTRDKTVLRSVQQRGTPGNPAAHHRTRFPGVPQQRNARAAARNARKPFPRSSAPPTREWHVASVRDGPGGTSGIINTGAGVRSGPVASYPVAGAGVCPGIDKYVVSHIMMGQTRTAVPQGEVD